MFTAGFYNLLSRHFEAGGFMSTSQQQLQEIYKNIAQVVVGKKESVLLALATLLCKGHLLVEDVPGVGKTMLARAIARSVEADFSRVQCTPDLLPSDITGVSVFNQQSAQFEFKRGPVFTNILLTDEINRTTPRVQSALLECMAEGQVSTDGTTHKLDPLFMVIATQNPVEFHGTYPLPEAQLDRFFMRIGMGYPNEDDELRIVEMQARRHPIEGLKPVIDRNALLALQDRVGTVRVDPSVARYAVALVRETRHHPEVQLGASPRGSIALLKAAQAVAQITGKEFVTPQMVKQVAQPVLGHRLVLRRQEASSGISGEAVVQKVMQTVPVPVEPSSATPQRA